MSKQTPASNLTRGSQATRWAAAQGGENPPIIFAGRFAEPS